MLKSTNLNFHPFLIMFVYSSVKDLQKYMNIMEIYICIFV